MTCLNAFGETYVYLGINTLQYIYKGICVNAEVLFGGPSITAQVCTGKGDDYETLNYEVGLKYYFKKYKGLNIQIAFPKDTFTYKNYSIVNPMSIAARLGWRGVIEIGAENKGIAFDANLGFGCTLDFISFWPLAVAGIGYQF